MISDSVHVISGDQFACSDRVSFVSDFVVVQFSWYLIDSSYGMFPMYELPDFNSSPNPLRNI